MFSIASIGCAISPSLGVLILARAVQGIGAAALVPGSLTLLNHGSSDPGARARAIGIWAAGGSVALSAGPIIGGLLIASAGWRAIFLINVPIGIAGVMLTLACASETPKTPRMIDVPGQVLAIAALGLLSAGIIESGRGGIGVWATVVGVAGGVSAAGVFVLVERRRSEPMLPLDLFQSRALAASTTVGLLINVTFYGLIFVFSLFFQSAQHLSPLLTGAAFAPMTVGVLVANLTSGRIAARAGTRLVVLMGLGLMAIGLGGLLGTEAGTQYGVLVLPLVALGLGIGAVVPSITSAQLGAVEANKSGIASGTLNTARQAGSVIGVALLGSIAGGSDVPAGLRVDLIIGLGVTVLAAAAAFAMGARGTTRSESPR